MTKTAILDWNKRRDVAAEREKELLRQTSDAVRLRQLQAMFATVKSQGWQVATSEDIKLVRMRWNKLRRIAENQSNYASKS